MFQKYKEIFFGLAFGIFAVMLDTGMDAMADGNSLTDEVSEHPGMLLYRAVFVVLGLILGWVLWQRNRREREHRELTEMLRRLQQECRRQTMFLRATLQNLLIRDDVKLSDPAAQVIQQAYQKTQELENLAEWKISGLDG